MNISLELKEEGDFVKLRLSNLFSKALFASFEGLGRKGLGGEGNGRKGREKGGKTFPLFQS